MKMEGANEKILVCVSNMYFAEKLIKRGKTTAKAFQTTCQVLNIEMKSYDEYDFDFQESQTILKKLCAENESSLHIKVKGTKRISEVIAEFVKENEITQIIIGQPSMSKWQVFTGVHLIQQLFNQLEGVDVHIVEVHKEKPTSAEYGYEKGYNAYLAKTLDGGYLVSTERTKETTYVGIFYKELATDFSNGIFKVKHNNKEILVHVLEGKVVALDESKLSEQNK